MVTSSEEALCQNCFHSMPDHDGQKGRCTHSSPETSARCHCFGFVHKPPAREHHDNVNHPKHYTSHPSGIECITVVEHMTFNIGNTIKYLWRSGLKGTSPLLEDLKKARWYLDREIARLEKRETIAMGIESAIKAMPE